MYDDDYYDDGYITCPYCDGEGRVMVCCDDLCRGSGQCLYESGDDPAVKRPAGCFEICRECKGVGEL